MTHAIVIIIVIILIIIRVIQVRVYGILVDLFVLNIVLEAIHLRKTASTLSLRTEATVPSSLLQWEHEATTLHLLGSGSDLRVEEAVNLQPAHFDRVPVGITLQQYGVVGLG